VRISRLIAGLALTLLVLCNAQGAHAQSSCPTSGMTDTSINVSVSGDCTISGDLIATGGDVTVVVSGGALTITGQVSATGGVSLTGDNGVSVGSTVSAAGGGVTGTSSGGTISLGSSLTADGTVNLSGYTGISVGSDINTSVGNIIANSANGGITISGTSTLTSGALFVANNDISLGGVSETASGFGGDVRIFPDQGGGSDPFQIGQAGAANGVASVNISSTSGGGYVYITNGGTGGITYSGTNSIQITASSGPTGSVILDGGSTSNVSLSGSVSVDNSVGFSAGSVYIFAPQITADGMTASASSQPGVYGGSIQWYTGAIIVNNGGLTLSRNGDGPVPSGLNFSLAPVGSYSVTAPQDLSQFISFGNYVASANPLAITGSGAFTINANGTNNGISINGYPLTLAPASTTINMEGSDEEIFISGTDGAGNPNSVTLGGTIQVHVNTTASGQLTGILDLDGSAIAPSPLTGNVLFDASGTNGGDGGIIEIYPGSGEVDIGSSGNVFTLLANGSSSGGSGGNISVDYTGYNIVVQDASGISASALGTTGNGGQIALNADNVTFSQQSASLNANAGSTTGSGGTIIIDPDNTLAFTGSSAGSVAIHANNSGAGQTPGQIQLSAPNISTFSNSVLLDASGTSGGDGGTITLFPGSGMVNLGTGAGVFALNANGSSTGGSGGSITVGGYGYNIVVEDAGGVTASALGTTGNGGYVELDGDDVNFTQSNASLNANGGTGTGEGGSIVINPGTLEFSGTTSAISANGGQTSGDGGSISLTPYSAVTVGSGTAGNVSLSAVAPLSGNGGSITIGYVGTLTLNGANALVTAAGNGNGGTLDFNNLGQTTITGTLTADGAGTGNGGSITIAETDSNTTTLDSSTISASGASSGNGNGNQITISNNADISMDGTSVNANGGGTGNGGTISVTTTGDITGTGQIDADGGCSDGIGGTITINANNVAFAGIEAGNQNGTICAAVAAARRPAAHPTVQPVPAKPLVKSTIQSAPTRPLAKQGVRPIINRLVKKSGVNPLPKRPVTKPSIESVTKRPAANPLVHPLTDPSTPSITLNINDWDASVLTSGVHADGTGSNNGGTITVNNMVAIDLSTLDQLMLPTTAITARSGPSGGTGGTVTIATVLKNPNPTKPNTYNPLDVLDIIDVNGQSTTAQVRNGLISLNSVECQQWNNSGTWPISWWDCTPNAATTQPSALDLVPVNTASGTTFSQIRALLQGTPATSTTYKQVTNIFVFANGGNPTSGGYDGFYGDNEMDFEGGITFKGLSGNFIYTNPWESGSVGDPNNVVNYDVSNYPEVAAHEIGHAVDTANGLPSSGATYGFYVNRDVYDLNNATVNGQPVTRDPCNPTAGSDDAAPFAGVLDMRDGMVGNSYAFVCTGDGGNSGVINQNILNGVGTQNPTNDQVLAYDAPGWINRQEINAQAFAYNAVGSLGAQIVTDAVFANGAANTQSPRYLGCVVAWAAAQLAGSNAGPQNPPVTPSGSCGVNP
jgi:hypothetical protein